MTAGFSREPTLFSAVVTPHRSLDRGGVRVVLLVIGGCGLLLGAVFLAAGAWPVTGFLGLDVALVYWALRVNGRRAAAREEIVVTASCLTVRRTAATGRVAEWTLNPVWARLDRETDPDFGLVRLALVSHGRRLVVGHWLSPAERAGFADALAAALWEARRGPTRAPAAVLGNRVDPCGGSA
ncbi:DUF2244 domain-containing protein [Rhodoplanes serenus]|uniref:DUF2244 domain-containing protein n=1 Tax=Rhodoplanes serenus TaxID=200615 RepID=UPI000DAB3D21|nr:DUF2244 domain-containing protein [Rhodoplanes serenus]MBI5113376.1 DUF2244 domain-containing protein [Rhodovulum sp.]RAI31370.1 hypothetical protein CH340_18895 [Rhodoplanes serenus]